MRENGSSFQEAYVCNKGGANNSSEGLKRKGEELREKYFRLFAKIS